jgi:hypothetical protein
MAGTLKAYFERAMIGKHWCKRGGGRRRVTVDMCAACKDLDHCEEGRAALREADLYVDEERESTGTSAQWGNEKPPRKRP